MAQSAWLAYEAAARKVLTYMREVLGISVVEGKQSVPGKNSPGWELDAKAWLENSTGFLVIEARRHTTSRLSQEAVAAIAYRMSDVGAAGGIVLTHCRCNEERRRLQPRKPSPTSSSRPIARQKRT